MDQRREIIKALTHWSIWASFPLSTSLPIAKKKSQLVGKIFTSRLGL